MMLTPEVIILGLILLELFSINTKLRKILESKKG